ncbi:MAG: HAMP domain-containing histidine kinase [Ignavibacteriae bacterium]|nr:HAMP domain-containing histidine kinase [Ignavibacteriota bacterium]MCB9260259.1 HAMP domain-containing histidine kinase [Ignavibacteriales bacterium]
MIKLVPEWAHDYEAYWNSIRNRNIWLIHLRYGAVLMLALIFIIASKVININFSATQIDALFIITISILIYNIFLHFFRKYVKCEPGGFNPLHLSLIQIVLDLIALLLLVYYTGSIETPLYMLFIFHMIIGSLILPGRVIIAIAIILTVIFNTIVSFEYFNSIPHHHLYGIHDTELKENFNFIITSIGLINFTIFTTVLITSRIAKRLYKREQELIATLKKLDEAEKAKQKYTMAVVHEIKSPIVASQSIIEIIKKGYLGSVNDKIQEKLDRVIKRSEEALNLINNILRISKLKLLDEVTYEKVDIKVLIYEIIEQKIETIKNKNIKLKFEAENLDSTEIDADFVLLELVISNVLGNAIKYTKLNGRISIRLEKQDNILFLDVLDNGIGIPENEIKMVFKQFYRASNLPDKSVEGSGLGLALVKEIVERLNGSINVNSPSSIGDEKNPGTSVRIILPITQTKN